MEERIDETLPEPLYAQLRDILKNKIVQGEYPVGKRIPSEDQLNAQYGVSRITIRRALSELANEGYLIKRVGKGSYVSDSWAKTDVSSKVSVRFPQNNDVQAFSESCLANDLIPGATLVRCLQISGIESERSFFGFGSDGKLLLVERIRTADGLPIMVEENLFPYDRYSFIEDEDLTDVSLYKLIGCHGYTEPCLREPCALELEKCPQKYATLLEVPAGEPLFCLTGRYYDSDGSAMYLGKQHIVGTRYTFRI